MHLLEKYKASGLPYSLASVNKLDSVAETNTTVVPRFLTLHSTTTKSLRNLYIRYTFSSLLYKMIQVSTPHSPYSSSKDMFYRHFYTPTENGLRHLNVPTALISNLNSTANVSRSSFQPHSYSIITVFRILSQFAPNSILA
ncbi:uncharacterized protein RAG0_15137 [Rhynchosporium agropyri]|uniref:Uncharacterized protein n=1 Tax=Rhynchosporium agropyri TaxID=914238 RepID=A0A1E1LJT3_9HELO|nr:uncharacterized protein RAG0_15137 [Rhynchosporium agropyri]